MPSCLDFVEHPAPDEAGVIRRIAEEMTRVARDYNASGNPPFRRAAHAKHHGLIKADFIVDADIPPELRHGIFAAPRAYSAWIRFSNSDPSIRHDFFLDAHGMAIKLLEVPGEKLLESERFATTHDLVLADHPVTFARDAAEFEAFARAIAAGKPWSYFFGGLRGTPHVAMFRRILRTLHRIGSPLAARYWSQTAYRLGPYTVKYSTVPASAARAFGLPLSRDYLRMAMAKHLDRSDAAFDFLVQVRTSEELPVEDATVEWSEKIAPFVKVATIRIPRQVFDSPDQLALAENLSFTPWHALPVHQPLGSINRTRRIVYETISRLRHEMNGVERVEPKHLDVPPKGILT